MIQVLTLLTKEVARKKTPGCSYGPDVVLYMVIISVRCWQENNWLFRAALEENEREGPVLCTMYHVFPFLQERRLSSLCPC